MKDRDFIINSLLDVDFYKFTMGQMIFHRHPSTEVELTFTNRTSSVKLAEVIDMGRLKRELDHCRELYLTPDEIHYIMGVYEYEKPMFRMDYIQFLKTLRLPEFHLSKTDDGQINLRFVGRWELVTYWETLAMSVINELYYEAKMKDFSKFERDLVLSEGKLRLGKKITELKKHPEITFSDFGTRRRFSREWQDFTVSTLAEECAKQFKGTSNVLLAKKYGLMPVGTNAHELPIVYSGIFADKDEIDPSYSSRMVVMNWGFEYGMGLSIFLPDTFGSDWFFKNVVDEEKLRNWKGSRHDSGDPIGYAEKRIAEYESCRIDPKTKLIIFADGLSVHKMVEISEKLNGRIQSTFGWGTDLSNDVGFPSIQIVVKPTKSDGRPVGKLTDDVSKATGSPEAIERWKNLVERKTK